MRIAQIGAGGWGKNHARILSQLGVLAAVCDADPRTGAKYGEKYSVPHYTNLDDMPDSEYDAAVICTPTSTHSEIASRLIGAKKHVFVEKPMTYLSKDGDALLSLARKNGVLLTCGYIERFNPAVDRVRQLINSGTYGKLIMLDFHRENRMPLHIQDVGIIYDTSVHDIDTAMWLFDGTPEMVFARAGQIRHTHEDFASIMLGFAGNRMAVISSNWITPGRIRTFDAICTDGILSSDFISQEVRIKQSDKTTIPEYKRQEPLLLEIQSFIGAVEGRNELVVTPQHAVNVTRIAEAALLSSQKGTPIYLDLK